MLLVHVVVLVLVLGSPAAAAASASSTADTSPPCTVLSSAQCADTCLPAGTADVTYACGDWWTRSDCCNGTELVPITTTSFYYRCSCRDRGMTSAGLAVILSATLAAVVAILAAVVYVLLRKKKKVEAEEEERTKAIEEAQVYLPR
jgi:cytochrome c oxidase assembly factor CtaG